MCRKPYGLYSKVTEGQKRHLRPTKLLIARFPNRTYKKRRQESTVASSGCSSEPYTIHLKYRGTCGIIFLYDIHLKRKGSTLSVGAVSNPDTLTKKQYKSG